LGEVLPREKIIPKEKIITLKVEKRRSFLPSEGLFLKSNFLSLRERPLRSRPSLSKEKKDN